MAIVETETHGAVFTIRMNRPERLNALGNELRAALSDAWIEFNDRNDVEVAIYTGTGRAFCAGEVMKESLDPVSRHRYGNLSGKVGWILLWLIGIPIPILIVLYLLRGCT